MSDEANPVRANGCVVWRSGRDATSIETGVEFLVVHRPRYDDWSFAKGKLDPGETDEECAERELLEETGMRARRADELTAVRYIDHKGRPKLVRYWLAERIPANEGGGDFVANDEVDEIAWLDAAATRERLSYDHDRMLVTEALTLLEATSPSSPELGST